MSADDDEMCLCHYRLGCIDIESLSGAYVYKSKGDDEVCLCNYRLYPQLLGEYMYKSADDNEVCL